MRDLVLLPRCLYPEKKVESFFPKADLKCPILISEEELAAGAKRTCTLTLHDSQVEVTGLLSTARVDADSTYLSRNPFAFTNRPSQDVKVAGTRGAKLKVTQTGVAWAGTVEVTGPLVEPPCPTTIQSTGSAQLGSGASTQHAQSKSGTPSIPLRIRRHALKVKAGQEMLAQVVANGRRPDINSSPVPFPTHWKASGEIDHHGGYLLTSRVPIPPKRLFSGIISLSIAPDGVVAVATIDAGASGQFDSPIRNNGQFCETIGRKCIGGFRMPW